MKRKIAFIVQRYGLEVNGGAEYHCRILVEKLKELYSIEVLTTCAKSYITWDNEYEAGSEIINGVKVMRFPVEHGRDKKRFRFIDREIKKRKLHHKILRFIGLLGIYEKLQSNSKIAKNEIHWMKEQGPYVPQLVDFLKEHHAKYDALVFFTYLYYPTVEGVKIAPEKTILIPTAHDEPPIYMNLFKGFFKTPTAILYNTQSEKFFVNNLFYNSDIYSDIVGVGIELSEPNNSATIPQLTKPYFIYIGRVDRLKGCRQLIEYFLKYKKTTGSDIQLVLVGQLFMKVDEHPDIIFTGFVEEDLKTSLLKNAEALIMPSFYESLSMVTLEGMAYGVPVIANERCEVLKDHINNSEAGFLYHNQSSFNAALNHLVFNKKNREELSVNAKKYVAENYTWDTVIKKFNKAVSYIIDKLR